jgi:hypothetical protein
MMLLYPNASFMPLSTELCFVEGRTAVLFRPRAIADLEAVVPQICSPRPVIVLVGGASALQEHHIVQLQSLFTTVLVPIAQALNAVVIDGGTDTGIMRLMGQTRQQQQATFPLVGVVPIGLARLPDSSVNPVPLAADAAPLEPHHTHFLLVPGTQWGDDSPWIAQLATQIAGSYPSVTVLINGGQITWQDAAASVESKRLIITVAGSGRTADSLAAALEGNATDERGRAIVASGLLQSVPLAQPEFLTTLLHQKLQVNTR